MTSLSVTIKDCDLNMREKRVLNDICNKGFEKEENIFYILSLMMRKHYEMPLIAIPNINVDRRVLDCVLIMFNVEGLSGAYISEIEIRPTEHAYRQLRDASRALSNIVVLCPKVFYKHFRKKNFLTLRCVFATIDVRYIENIFHIELDFSNVLSKSHVINHVNFIKNFVSRKIIPKLNTFINMETCKRTLVNLVRRISTTTQRVIYCSEDDDYKKLYDRLRRCSIEDCEIPWAMLCLGFIPTCRTMPKHSYWKTRCYRYVGSELFRRLCSYDIDIIPESWLNRVRKLIV